MRLPASLALAITLVAVPAAAQPRYETLHSFIPDGGPSTLTVGTDGRIYGVTSAGGDAGGGAIFAIDRHADGTHTFNRLHSFTQAEGWHPAGPLLEVVAGIFCGTTFDGGSRGAGTIYCLTGTLDFFVVRHLNPTIDGGGSRSGLTLGPGGLYGMTSYGGVSGGGTIFRLGSGFTVMHAFSGADGSGPSGTLTLGPHGAFYGTTRGGGPSGLGTVFKMFPSGAFTQIGSFSHLGGINTPLAGVVVGPGGALWGTASAGTCFGFCTAPRGGLFAAGLDGPASERYADHTFNYRSPLTVASDGKVYGTLEGVRIFRIVTDLPFPTDREIVFESPESWGSGEGGIVETADHMFYGSSASGGPGGNGTIFKYDPATGVGTLVHVFGVGGYHPQGGMVLASDGNIYGTTLDGGAFGNGTLFKWSAADGHSALDSGPEHGGKLTGDLIEASSGDLIGTTTNAPFRATTTGAIEVTAACGEPPSGPLLEQPDGFYATRVAALGLVRYPLTLDGCPEILHTFSGPDGFYPYGGMIKASDGFFYGTTQAGGTSGNGTIFRLAADGTHTVIHHFSGANGDRPLGTLVQASDGHLYGTTIFGGAFGRGSIFRITLGGVFTSMHSFTDAEGIAPFAGLVVGPGQALYGTAVAGGNGTGSVFVMTTGGAFAVVHRFGAGEGAYPLARLTVGLDNALYGTTYAGGNGNAGTIFRIVLIP